MKYIAQLDGLRGLAVISVILYHFGYGIDGTAGVTVFFTLSGYLITSLILNEHETTGTLDLKRFYERRVRRLLPAATACVIATLAYAYHVKEDIHRQAVAALTYWANWERFTSHVAYGDTGFAPLTHFWSLSIEEQFYFVLPVIALLCLKVGKRFFGAVCFTGFIASLSYAQFVGDDVMSYFNTGARVWEILTGSLLALWRFRGHVASGYIALLALIASVIFWHPHHLIVSALTTVIISSAPAILSVRPLVAVGKVSYGLYLFHPLVALMFDGFMIRTTILIGATIMSYYLIERPVRFKLNWGKARLTILAMSLTAFATACFGPYDKRDPFVPDVAPVIAADPTTTTGAETATTLPAKLRISVAGDSTMTHIGSALNAWAGTSDIVEWVYPPDDIQPWTGGPGSPEYGLERPGCGLLAKYNFRWRASDKVGANENANRAGLDEPHVSCDWREWVPSALSRMNLDVLVVSYGVSSMWEHNINGKWLHAGQPKYDQVLAATMDEFEREAAKYGTKVIWVIYPYVSVAPGLIPAGDSSYRAMEDHAVTDAVAAMTQARPCWADLRPMYLADPGFQWYYDTDHMTPEASARAAAEIVPAIPAC